MMNKIDYDELSKLNIENLFSTDINKPYCGNIDINTLFKNEKKYNEDFSFDSKLLLKNLEKKRKKIKKCYSDIYKTCCDTIISANNSGLTDIIFQVPDDVPDCLNYNFFDCINNIIKELTEQKITCLQVSKTKIFISWVDLESKLD